MRRAVWAVLLGVLLSACGVYEVKDAAIDSVDVEVLPDATVRVVSHGTLGDGCTRVGEVTQRREAQTFFISIKEVYDQPFGMACTLTVGEFRQEVLLDVQGLERGSYKVDVNGVTESFGLDGEGVFVKGGYASVLSVDAQVLPSDSGARVGVFIEGEFGDPCVELRGVAQTHQENLFRLELETWTRTDIACLPVTEFFWKFVTLTFQTLPPGLYRVEVAGSDTVTTSFRLHEATYREANVTGLEVPPLEEESFAANVIVRGELQNSCEVIAGAVEQQGGTDRDALPDEEFFITLVSRITGSCGNETIPFREVVPIDSYGSGTYTVTVNGVVETFTFPGAVKTFTLP